MTALKEQLMIDLKESMKNKDVIKKQVITLIRSAMKQKEVDERVEVDNDDVISIISKQLKQRKDSLPDYEKSGRDELILDIKKEIQILESYLPQQLTDEELKKVVTEAIRETGASSQKDMGKVMSYVMPKVKGKADGKRINSIASKILNQS